MAAAIHAAMSPYAPVTQNQVFFEPGQYRREQLFEATRRSRACAYLADDDHGPLALQEILLAGGPVVGVRTGAPFIQDGVTGVFVERLPPGAKCLENDADAAALGLFVAGIQRGLTSTFAVSDHERFLMLGVATPGIRFRAAVR